MNNALGRPKKKKIISRLKAYHGVTIAAASLTGLANNHRDFDLPIAGILHTVCPHHYRFAHDGESEHEFARRLETTSKSDHPARAGDGRSFHRGAGDGCRRGDRSTADYFSK
jgi:adenosylmethionine-8-amino-7-oxononanoate aminotransferase